MTTEDDMAWVEFTADFDWDLTPRVTTAYKAGARLSVKRACADAAKAAGKAVDIATPARAARPTAAESGRPGDDDGRDAAATVTA